MSYMTPMGGHSLRAAQTWFGQNRQSQNPMIYWNMSPPPGRRPAGPPAMFCISCMYDISIYRYMYLYLYICFIYRIVSLWKVFLYFDRYSYVCIFSYMFVNTFNVYSYQVILLAARGEWSFFCVHVIFQNATARLLFNLKLIWEKQTPKPEIPTWAIWPIPIHMGTQWHHQVLFRQSKSL